MITSCLYLVTEIWLLLGWKEIGPKVAVSSTMTRRLSLSGSMRRTSSASSPCRREEMFVVCLKDLPMESKQLETQLRKNLAKISVWMKSMDTFTLAQPILELVWEHLSMLIFLDGLSTVWMSWRKDVRNCIYSLAVPEENLVVKQDSPMIFPTSTG